MNRLALLAFLCFAVPAMGQTKTTVVFDCTCSDPVGARFATAVRDALASSPRYMLGYTAVEKDKDGKATRYHWHLKAVSLDPTPDNEGRSTAISLVLLVGDDVFLTHMVQSCGINKVDSCAADAVSFMDGYINSK